MTVKPSRKAGTIETKTVQGKVITNACNTTTNYLICNSAKRRVTGEDGQRKCDNRKQVRLDKIEPTILDEVLKIALDGDRFNQREASDARVALAEVERLIEFKREQAGKLGENLKNQVSDTLMNMLIIVEKEIRALEVDRNKLIDASAAERGVAETPAMLLRIRETREKIDSEDRVERLEARSMVAGAVRNVISDITCDRDANTMVIIASGLAAFRMDNSGKVTWRFDGSGDPRLVKGVTSGSFERNAARVDTIIQRTKALSAQSSQ